MTKCLYTESDVTKTGGTIVVTGISMDMNWQGLEQKKFAHTFGGAYKSIQMMVDPKFSPGEDFKEESRPALGDVIWLRTGGNQMIGFGIVKKRGEDPIHTEALKTVFKNYNAKAKEMKTPLIGMDVYGSDSGEDWASIHEIIEEELTDCQAVVCVPTNELLLDVLDHLPGETQTMTIPDDKE